MASPVVQQSYPSEHPTTQEHLCVQYPCGVCSILQGKPLAEKHTRFIAADKRQSVERLVDIALRLSDAQLQAFLFFAEGLTIEAEPVEPSSSTSRPRLAFSNTQEK